MSKIFRANICLQAHLFGSEDFHNSSPTQVLDDFRGSSLKNPSVDKMRNELYSLKSLVSKLEHVRGNDGEQSQTSSIAGDNEVEVFEERTSRYVTNLTHDSCLNGTQMKEHVSHRKKSTTDPNQTHVLFVGVRVVLA